MKLKLDSALVMVRITYALSFRGRMISSTITGDSLMGFISVLGLLLIPMRASILLSSRPDEAVHDAFS